MKVNIIKNDKGESMAHIVAETAVEAKTAARGAELITLFPWINGSVFAAHMSKDQALSLIEKASDLNGAMHGITVDWYGDVYKAPFFLHIMCDNPANKPQEVKP